MASSVTDVHDPRFEPTAGVVPDGRLGFAYDADAFGPAPEVRSLDAIRATLLDADARGPTDVYSIVMDVGRRRDRDRLLEHRLLFGVVSFAAGTIGEEPVRSQGHVHAITPATGWSPPEVFQIWEGRAVILMQERADDDPGRVFAVHAEPGDVVVTPPGWAHATINADPTRQLTFGAWCDRGYAGFAYRAVRARGGLAWHAVIREGSLCWRRNDRYRERPLIETVARREPGFDIRPGTCIYAQAIDDPARFAFVPDARVASDAWVAFDPGEPVT
jgi:glucose-6-phosphate isomerase, archaeal